jgi:glycosyltransferase involved in cell wall biosynthesis
VSVVVPVLNAGRTLGAQLDALASQTCAAPWELIIADNGSTDGSIELASSRLDEFPAGRVLDASARRGASHARNAGARAATGELLVFCDADDVVSPGWLAAMTEAAGDADVVAGPFDVERLNDTLRRSWHDTPPKHRPLRGHRFLEFASGGNCAVWQDVFESLGGYDEERPTGEDVDLSWRAQLAGYRLGFAAEGVVYLRLKSGLRDIARQHFHWGRGYVDLYRDFRADGMPRPGLGEVALAWGWILLLGPVLALSGRTRGLWVRRAAQRTGQATGSVAERVLFL